MQTRYKKVAGSVCGFPKFVTSGSGLGFQKSNSGFGFGFRVRKFPKKTGFGFGLGFVKNVKISAKFP
jgi:hypothetical protein